jgi:hypothetical protein
VGSPPLPDLPFLITQPPAPRARDRRVPAVCAASPPRTVRRPHAVRGPRAVRTPIARTVRIAGALHLPWPSVCPAPSAPCGRPRRARATAVCIGARFACCALSVLLRGVRVVRPRARRSPRTCAMTGAQCATSAYAPASPRCAPKRNAARSCYRRQQAALALICGVSVTDAPGSDVTLDAAHLPDRRKPPGGANRRCPGGPRAEIGVSPLKARAGRERPTAVSPCEA